MNYFILNREEYRWCETIVRNSFKIEEETDLSTNQSNEMNNEEQDDTLTNRQGHPITNNQDLRTIGNRGPAVLENYDFLEKISHFDRERIPKELHTFHL